MNQFRTFKAISGPDGLDPTQKSSPASAPSGAKKKEILQIPANTSMLGRLFYNYELVLIPTSQDCTKSLYI